MFQFVYYYYCNYYRNVININIEFIKIIIILNYIILKIYFVEMNCLQDSILIKINKSKIEMKKIYKKEFTNKQINLLKII